MSEYLVERIDTSYIYVKAESAEDALEVANNTLEWSVEIGVPVAVEQ